MPTVNLELVPFPVPAEVIVKMPPGRRQDGMKPVPTLQLADLDPTVLDALLLEFTEAVYRAAGREQP